MLHGLPRVDDVLYVFRGTKERVRLVGPKNIWHRLRSRAEPPDVRLHIVRWKNNRY